MEIAVKKYLVLFALIIIQGCSSSGGDSSTATDPNTEFHVFPSGYFTAGYTDTINYTGTGTDGSSYTASLSDQTQTPSTFLGQSAIPILEQLQVTNTSTGATASGISTEYFSTDPNDRHYLGESSTTTTTVTAVTSAIPQIAKIGDIGIIGTYTDNAGGVSERSWRLDDGLNGRAKRVVLTTERDQFGTVTTTITETNLIDTSGNVISSNVVISYHDLGVTLTLNGS